MTSQHEICLTTQKDSNDILSKTWIIKINNWDPIRQQTVVPMMYLNSSYTCVYKPRTMSRVQEWWELNKWTLIRLHGAILFVNKTANKTLEALHLAPTYQASLCLQLHHKLWVTSLTDTRITFGHNLKGLQQKKRRILKWSHGNFSSTTLCSQDVNLDKILNRLQLLTEQFHTMFLNKSQWKGGSDF